MRNKFLLVVTIILIMLSCNNGNRNAQNKNDVPDQAGTSATKSDSVLNCFQYAKNRDTISLKTIDVNGFVTGTLLYSIYEKDKNIGTIQGKMTGDLLVADYTFMSEGTTSVRQVVFKKVENTFLEGYGETEYKGDKVLFSNLDSLSFNSEKVLKKIDCEK